MRTPTHIALDVGIRKASSQPTNLIEGITEMQKPDHHILVCASFRGTEAKGKCIKKESMQLIPYMEEELADRGINAMVSSTGCLKLCEEGPVLVVYPEGHWYRGVTSQDVVDEILDALEEGRPAKEYLMT